MKQVVTLWDVTQGENSKAKYRRVMEGFFDRYCFGEGIEVGNHDPLLPNIRCWQDAGEPDDSYDFVYSSLLQEQGDPHASLQTWFRAVRPGGYLILYVPSRDLFEKKLSPPSTFNVNTKTFWLTEHCDDPGVYNLLQVVQDALALHGAQVVRTVLCDNEYGSHSHHLPSWGEYSYEVVIKKKRPIYPQGAYPLPGQQLNITPNSGNWSLMRYAEKWHAVFRVDEARKAENPDTSAAKLVYAQLDDKFNLVAQRKLIVTPDLSCEDPRLFVYKNRLWLAYNGAAYKPNSFRQHIVNLQDGQPATVYPLERYQATDKNWMYFERDGNLYAVYSIDPHVVVRIDGDKIEEVGRTEPGIVKKHWWYGEPRGGSCPWYIGNDEFLTFFQSHYIPSGFYRRVYVMGAYVFSSKPPFGIKRITRMPLIVPDRTDVALHAVVFPGGAVFADDKWLVPFGYNDSESRMAVFTREQVDSLMVPV